MRENVFIIRKSSKFKFNIKKSFSYIKEINDINFINIKLVILEISSLFLIFELNFKYFKFIINIKIVLI